MQDTLTVDRPASSAYQLVVPLLIIDSLHFVFARLLLSHISPGVSAMYVLAIATLEVGLFALISGRLHPRVLKRQLWFFLVIGFLVAARRATRVS